MHDGILNYMKVGNLIIRKIFKINATRRHILRLTAPPRLPSWYFRGHTSKKGGEGKGKEGKTQLSPHHAIHTDWFNLHMHTIKIVENMWPSISRPSLLSSVYNSLVKNQS